MKKLFLTIVSTFITTTISLKGSEQKFKTQLETETTSTYQDFRSRFLENLDQALQENKFTAASTNFLNELNTLHSSFPTQLKNNINSNFEILWYRVFQNASSLLKLNQQFLSQNFYNPKQWQAQINNIIKDLDIVNKESTKHDSEEGQLLSFIAEKLKAAAHNLLDRSQI